jgi:hypothetical protein
MEMTKYDYMWWLFRYGMISEKEWIDFCYSISDKVIFNEETKKIFKRLKYA